jgi:hypothetical protein
MIPWSNQSTLYYPQHSLPACNINPVQFLELPVNGLSNAAPSFGLREDERFISILETQKE